MTPTLAEIRIATYAKRHGSVKDSSVLRKRIVAINQELPKLSLWSSRFRTLTHERFELNSYAEALDTLKDNRHA